MAAYAIGERIGERAMEAGFSLLEAKDGTDIGVWYPALGTPLCSKLGFHEHTVIPEADVVAGTFPLIVISHGSGGDFTNHLDTAEALAREGYVVAALSHPGDNATDRSRAHKIEDRPRGLSRLIDHMLLERRFAACVDPSRIGALGFSAGGFSVLVAAGGRPDFSLIGAHCRANPDFFDSRQLAGAGDHWRPDWSGLKDERIQALVVAAPALGFTFRSGGLDDVSIPVQLWRADDDAALPRPHYADAVRLALPQEPDFQTVTGADHFDFVAEIADNDAAPAHYRHRDGFDRVAFHSRFNREVCRFFNDALGR